MHSDIKDSVVIITGGAGGIGSKIAHTFAAAGARVVVAGRNAEKLEALATQIRSDGHTCLPLTCDVTDADQVEALMAGTEAEFGRIDVMINNAGGAMSVSYTHLTLPTILLV